MRFSSDHRADILTESLRFSNLFSEKFAQNKVYLIEKYENNLLT